VWLHQPRRQQQPRRPLTAAQHLPPPPQRPSSAVTDRRGTWPNLRPRHRSDPATEHRIQLRNLRPEKQPLGGEFQITDSKEACGVTKTRMWLHASSTEPATPGCGTGSCSANRWGAASASRASSALASRTPVTAPNVGDTAHGKTAAVPSTTDTARNRQLRLLHGRPARVRWIAGSRTPAGAPRLHGPNRDHRGRPI